MPENTSLDAKTIGRRIKEARERRGMLQNELAQRLGRSQRALSDYEAGNFLVKIPELVSIADILETPVLYFIQGETSPAAALDEQSVEMLNQLRRLSRPEDRNRAIELVRILSDAIEQNTSA